MRYAKLLLFAFTFVCIAALPVFAQDNKPAEQKSTKPADQQAPAAANKEEAKNEVTQMLDEAKKRGDRVLARCIENCGDVEGSGEKVMVGHAVTLPKPKYSPLARAAHASGEVVVQVIIDTDGKVIAAAAVSGHPLLFAASVQAARDSVFTPTYFEGQPVKVTGALTYRFVPQ